MKIGVAAYSFPFTCGFMRRDGRSANERPMDAFALARLATEYGLTGIETPLQGMLADVSPAGVDQLRAELEAAGLSIVVDTGVVDVDVLRFTLPLAAHVGAKVVRATLSPILEGDRASLLIGWDTYIAEMRRRIGEIVPMLKAHNLVLALENHQDATSDDLLSLCELDQTCIGATLDMANPLAVAEEPVEFARKLGPHVYNVHIKDYRIYRTSSGYRLVRCAIGEGVIPFETLLPALQQWAPQAMFHIELAALYARHIRLLEDSWWTGYPPRDVRDVLPALRFLAQHAHDENEEYRTPWELNSSNDELAAYERMQFEQSVRYLTR